MPSGRYKFSRRNRSIEGFFSKNTPSTDALNALIAWSSIESQRKYQVISDADELLSVTLHWAEADSSAGRDLEDACRTFGVERAYEGE